MDRRTFVLAATSAALAPLARAGQSPLELHLSAARSDWPVIPADFIGLSYEMGQMYNTDFFSPRNQPLIEAFRNLNTSGVLRLGGHLSNITPWEGVGLDDPKQIRGVRHGIEDYWEWPLVDPQVQRNKHGMLTRHALENLRGFLDAVNWRLMYGLNFACGSAARAADEAAAVTRIMGPRLIAFVIGNEDDGFGDDPFFRDKGYDVHQYLDEYEAWVRTIRASVPHAQFAGPDTDGKVDSWVLDYARHTRGDALMLASHYYGMGPAGTPGMTAERLLRNPNHELEAEIAGVARARAAAGGTPYRMDEGNSCFNGGQKDVSDAYAAALWAADYALRVACAGFAGINLHGGGVGVYTPIESSDASPALARPVYYGLLFAQRFVGAQIAQCSLDTSANVTAYHANKEGKRMVAIVNKGDAPVQVELPESLRDARRWDLRGASLEAKTGVTFGRGVKEKGARLVEVPAISGAILEMA
jgi:hypothetical protein